MILLWSQRQRSICRFAREVSSRAGSTLLLADTYKTNAYVLLGLGEIVSGKECHKYYVSLYGDVICLVEAVFRCEPHATRSLD